MKNTLYDAVIVGSGPTGGYAAKSLSEAGLRVLVLDAGRHALHDKALLLYDSVRRRLGYRIEEDPAAVRRQPTQSSCYPWPQHPHAFVDDLENPYVTAPGQPFAWIRSRHLGGRMIVRQHGLQFYRLSAHDFKAGSRDGASPDWPLSYDDLVPYYERVERWLKVSGSMNHLVQLPDSVLSATRDLNAGEVLLSAGARRNSADQLVIPGRTAAPPVPITDAIATGRCTLRSNAIASRLVTSRDGQRITQVEFVDRRTRRTHSVQGRAVILCASAIESARLLLASAGPRHEQGLGNSSGALGRYLMDHTHLTGFHATMPLTEPVRTASWAYIPRFRNLNETAASGFTRGYGLQVFTMWRECALTSFGEMLPHPENRVTLDPDHKDAYGVPIARISCVHRENELAMIQDQVDACRGMLERSGFELTASGTQLSVPGLACHEVGTARMGTDPKESVLTSFCQSWDVANLFVMDGACFVSQGVQNPTLTMMALAARSCDYLVEALRRGDVV